jgi:glycosyltransferase involved in cell wall biosynthesis
MEESCNGAERFSYEIARNLGAKLYTTYYRPDIADAFTEIAGIVHPTKFRFNDIWYMKPLEAIYRTAVRKDIDADFILYSSHFTPYRILVDDTPYLYYCHSPARDLYDMRSVFVDEMNKSGYARSLFGRSWLNARTVFDQYLFRNRIEPRQVVTNSKLTYKRYVKYYGLRPRGVINPPVRIDNYYNAAPEDYYLTISRLSVNKRIDWQIEAFANNDEKLIIAGDGGERSRLERLARDKKSNVEFRGRVTDEELRDLYAHCKAFIFSAYEEDFGLVPIEAMASGKPVICVNDGGPLEYLNRSNSFLFNDIKELRMIVNKYKISDYEAMKDACLKSAKRFDVSVVAGKIMKNAREIIAENYS